MLSRDPPLASMDESSPHDAADNQVLEVHHTPVGTVVKVSRWGGMEVRGEGDGEGWE